MEHADGSVEPEDALTLAFDVAAALGGGPVDAVLLVDVPPQAACAWLRA